MVMINKIHLKCFLIFIFSLFIISFSCYSQKTEPKLRLSLKNTKNNLVDETVVYFTNNATDGYDYLYDAIKLMNSGNSPNIYSLIPGVNIAINGLPTLTTDKLVKLGVQSPVDENGLFIIKADSINNFPAKTSIYLMDSLLSKYYKLAQSTTQSFTYNSSNSKKRFSLCFDIDGIGPPTSTFNIEPKTVQVGDTAIITFTGAASSNAVFTWNFDGATYIGKGSGPYKVVWTATGNKKVSLGIKGTCFSSATTTKIERVKYLTHATISPAGPISICEGNTVLLNANKGNNFYYKWKKNTVDINNATNDSYTVNQSGSYTVVITGSDSIVTSKPVIITVNPLPTVIISPTGPLNVESVVLKANSISIITTYQWYKNNVLIPDATNSTFEAIPTGLFSVSVIDNNGCSNTSNIVKLDPPIIENLTITNISANPKQICLDETTTIQVSVAGGKTPYEYNWSPVDVGNTYSFIDQPVQTVTYNVTVTDALDSVRIGSIEVVVSNVPIAEINANGSTTFCSGGSVTLNPTVSDIYSYQWKMNGNNIPGATNFNYVVTQSGNYTVTLSLNSCSKQSGSITVTVTDIPQAGINANGSTTFCAGGSVTLNPAVTNIYYYQWKMNGFDIQGATNFNYTAIQSGEYSVSISLNNCSKVTGSLTVTVINTDANITPVGPVTLKFGMDTVLTATEVMGNSYKWYKNGQILTGQNSNTFRVNESGNYYVIITNNGCVKQSNTVDVTISQLQINITPIGPISFTLGDIIRLTANGGLLSSNYQWYKNDTLIEGATDIIYDAAAVGRYYVITTTFGSSVISNTVILYIPDICSQVSDPKVIINEPGKVVLSWTSNTPDQLYIVRVAKINSDNSYDFHYLYRVTSDTTATFSILENNTKYRWTVKAWCGTKSNNLGYIPNSFFTTQEAICPKARNLTHNNVMNNSAFLSWTSIVPKATYKIRYCLMDNKYYWKYRKLSSTSFDLLWLKQGSWYSWQVKVLCSGINQTPYSVEVDAFKTTGMTEQLKLSAVTGPDNFMIYPNPSNGVFTLSLTGIDNSVNINITDIKGQEVYNQLFSGSITNDIDLSALSKGMYYVRLISRDGIQVKKIVVQ